MAGIPGPRDADTRSGAGGVQQPVDHWPRFGGRREIGTLSEIAPEDLRRIAHAKRFVERYSGDAAFRAKVAEDAPGAAARYGLAADAAEIRTLWDPDTARREIESGASPSPRVALCLRYPRYGRVLADLLVEGTHTVDDLVARLAGFGATSFEVSPLLDLLFQGGVLDTEAAPHL